MTGHPPSRWGQRVGREGRVEDQRVGLTEQELELEPILPQGSRAHGLARLDAAHRVRAPTVRLIQP
jgi:hypothetical protein